MHRVSITFSDEEWQKIQAFRRSQPIQPSAAAVVRHLVASVAPPSALSARTVVPPASSDALTPPKRPWRKPSVQDITSTLDGQRLLADEAKAKAKSHPASPDAELTKL